MKKILFVLLFVSLCFTACDEPQSGVNIDHFTWQLVDNEMTITGYTGPPGTVRIPAELHGHPVRVIGWDAFVNRGLTSVTIPNSVTTIGESAFLGNQLTSVTIPNSVTTIGGAAFHSNQLTSVTIPNSVTTIGESAFSSNQLINVTIPNSVTTIEGRAFLLNRLASITIPNSVNHIGFLAFTDNPLISVTIGAGVNIDLYAFGNEFEDAYEANSRRAGTYTRPDVNSWEWTWRP